MTFNSSTGCVARLLSASIYHLQKWILSSLLFWSVALLPPSAFSQDTNSYTFKTVHFASGASALPNGRQRELDKLSDWLQKNPGTKVEIRGHTDNVGDLLSNLELSLARATAVKDYLLWNFVDTNRIRVQGVGSMEPQATNRTEEGRYQNRRVQLIIYDSAGNPLAKEEMIAIMQGMAATETQQVEKVFAAKEGGALNEMLQSVDQMKQYIELSGGDKLDEMSPLLELQMEAMTKALDYDFDNTYKTLFKLNHLQALDLRGYALDTLPDQFDSLPLLEVLGIGDNHLKDLPPSFNALQKLEILDMGGNQFSTVPPVIGELTNLKQLRLDWNDLEQLPPHLSNLQQLELLNVWHAFLKADSIDLTPISALPNLKELKLSENNLEVFPDVLCALSHLQILQLNENNLTTLPECVSQLQALEYLTLHANRVEHLPASFRTLSHLKELDLGDNPDLDVKHILPILAQLPKLEKLILSGIPMKSLPEEIAQLQHLKVLELNDCGLDSLPDAIGALQHLEALHLKRNRLSALPDTLGALSHLETLTINYNEIKELPASFERLAALEYLNVVGNQVKIFAIGSWKKKLPGLDILF